MSVTTDTLYAGDPIRMTATFTDTAGLLTDPDTVTFRYVAPDLTQYLYAYPAVTVTKESTGVYHCDQTTTRVQYGTWEGECVGTGVLPKTVAEIWTIRASI